jgi:hypothetical protein
MRIAATAPIIESPTSMLTMTSHTLPVSGKTRTMTYWPMALSSAEFTKARPPARRRSCAGFGLRGLPLRAQVAPFRARAPRRESALNHRGWSGRGTHLYVAHCLPVALDELLSCRAFWPYFRQWSCAIASISCREDRQVSPAAHSISRASGACETTSGYAHDARRPAARVSRLGRGNIKLRAALRIMGSRPNITAPAVRIGPRPIRLGRSTNMAKIRDSRRAADHG